MDLARGEYLDRLGKERFGVIRLQGENDEDYRERISKTIDKKPFKKRDNGMYIESDTKKVSILGTEYTIIFAKDGVGKLARMDGYTDDSTKEIVVAILEPDENSKADLGSYQKKVLRHEIVHAFLSESGLDASSNGTRSWATNEEMVDWIARQHSKLHAAFEEAGAL